MTTESQEELDRTEVGYQKVMVDLHAYDGRTLKGFIYTQVAAYLHVNEIFSMSGFYLVQCVKKYH